MNADNTILVVEDNDDDVYFLRRALRAAGVEQGLYFVADGQAALDYLLGSGDFADRQRYPLPSLVLLDLKLPFVHGFDVLTQVRSDAALHSLRVVVLTSSSEERDRERARALAAEGYLVKPATREMLLPFLKPQFVAAG